MCSHAVGAGVALSVEKPLCRWRMMFAAFAKSFDEMINQLRASLKESHDGNSMISCLKRVVSAFIGELERFLHSGQVFLDPEPNSDCEVITEMLSKCVLDDDKGDVDPLNNIGVKYADRLLQKMKKDFGHECIENALPLCIRKSSSAYIFLGFLKVCLVRKLMSDLGFKFSERSFEKKKNIFWEDKEWGMKAIDSVGISRSCVGRITAGEAVDRVHGGNGANPMSLLTASVRIVENFEFRQRFGISCARNGRCA